MLYQRPYQRLLLPLLPQAADASSPATSEAPAGAGGGEPAATPVGRRMLAASSSPPPPASGSPDAGEGAWFIQLSNLNQLGHVLEGYALSATCLVRAQGMHGWQLFFLHMHGGADCCWCPAGMCGTVVVCMACMVRQRGTLLVACR